MKTKEEDSNKVALTGPRFSISKSGRVYNPSVWTGPKFLISKSDRMLNLSVRLSQCEQALRDYDDIPDIMKTMDYAQIAKTALLRTAANRRKQFGQTTNDKLNALKEAQQDKIFDEASMNEELKFVKKSLKCNIYDRASLGELKIGCIALSDIFYSVINLNTKGTGIDIDKYISTANHLGDSIIGKSHEAIGYWTAKLEEKKRNKEGGAKKKSEIGKTNRDAIKVILSELGITSLSVFRQDKKLRESFYNKAKEATHYGVPLSEERISKIARALLRG